MAGWNQLSRIEAPAVSPVSVHGYQGTRRHQSTRPRRWRCSASAFSAAEAMNASKPSGHNPAAQEGRRAAAAMACSTAYDRATP
jgi:hypothetical protein